MQRIGTGKLRQQNDLQLLRCLIKGQVVTKRTLAKATGLTFATVGNILNDFIKEQIVIEDKLVLSKKGRPSVSYTLNPDYFHSLSLILTRRKQQNYLYYQISDALKNVLFFDFEVIDLTNIDNFTKRVKEIVYSDDMIKIIGVGVPGILYQSNLIDVDIGELKGLNLKKIIEQAVNIKTIVKNEMNYCAYGFYEQLDEKKDVCYVTFPNSSGLGCGSIINGRILEGDQNIAGEIIYLPFFNYLKQNDLNSFVYDNKNVALALTCLISIINPAYLIIHGEGLKNVDIEEVNNICLNYIPEFLMAKIIYRQDYIDDFFRGLQSYLNQSFLDIY